MGIRRQKAPKKTQANGNLGKSEPNEDSIANEHSHSAAVGTSFSVAAQRVLANDGEHGDAESINSLVGLGVWRKMR